MKLLFDDDLIDGVVQLCANGRWPGIPALQVRRFHVERERCYQILDPDERGTAFARLQLGWFNEWGFAESLGKITAQFAELPSTLAAMAFRKARARNDESAELYRDPEGQWRGIVALRPERLADHTALTRFLHHELAHLADMVNPDFGYSPELGQTGQTASQLRLTRERYRLLWDVSIDGRLVQRRLDTVADEAQRRHEFNRGFAFLPAARREELFDALWHGRLARHVPLLEIAADPRGLQGRHDPVPGAACPLCGFATFQWTDIDRLRIAARERMRADFPGWCDRESVCARCAEMYDAITGLEYPTTVVL
jgi:hypothetical protein